MVEENFQIPILLDAVDWLYITLDFFTMVEENFEIESFQLL